MLKLFDLSGKDDLRFSPPCWNVKLCLMHKQINYETIPVRFSEKHKIKFSKQNLVPILKHQNGFVCDSWNIINWIDENFDKNKLFINETNKRFSYFLYFWTSRQLLPILFKIIAHEIPNILEGDDIDYYINSREKKIMGPITKFKADINFCIQEFRKIISPIRKIVEENAFISGKNPGVEDYIFFGNLKWVDIVSSVQLLDKDDPIYKWYKNILKKTNSELH